MKLKYVILACACIIHATTHAIFTPLAQAMANGDIDTVKGLVESGEASVHDSSNPLSDAPLITEAMMLLSPHNQRSEENKKNIRTIIYYLVEKGAPLNTKGDEYAVLPIHLAARRNENDLLRFFVEHGADINAQDSRFGKTALHEAIEQANLEGFRMLLNAGANAKIANKKGETPYQLLIEKLEYYNAPNIGFTKETIKETKSKLQKMKEMFGSYDINKNLKTKQSISPDTVIITQQ